MIIGMLMVAAFRIFDKKTVRVEWQAIGGFLGFMAVVTFLRISMYDYVHMADPDFIPKMHGALLEMPKIMFSLVWWEDGFYVLPIVLAFRYLPKKIAIAFAIFMSAWFGTGHLYQGISGVFITSLYPYLVAYRFGKKYGYGTVMVGHVLYDYITYYTVIVAPLLL